MRELPFAQTWIPRLDVGDWLDAALSWMRDNLGFIFNLIRTVVGTVVEWVGWVLHTPPPIVVIVAFTLLMYVATRRWGITAFTLLSFLLVASMGRFGEAMDSLALVVVAAALAVLLGVPIGIWASRNSVVSSAVKPVLDFMQTMPSFIYLLLAVLFFRIGVVPGVMASLIFAMPPAVRLTELGIRQVDAEVVEAAHAFGASPRDVLFGVQLPLARPTIMAGVNQVIMLTLSMVVIAGLAGAPGLGATVVEGVARLRFDIGIEGGLGIVILAIFLDRVTAAFGADDVVRTGEA
jgi:glycine betaine/proline transport system permease protein